MPSRRRSGGRGAPRSTSSGSGRALVAGVLRSLVKLVDASSCFQRIRRSARADRPRARRTDERAQRHRDPALGEIPADAIERHEHRELLVKQPRDESSKRRARSEAFTACALRAPHGPFSSEHFVPADRCLPRRECQRRTHAGAASTTVAGTAAGTRADTLRLRDRKRDARAVARARGQPCAADRGALAGLGAASPASERPRTVCVGMARGIGRRRFCEVGPGSLACRRRGRCARFGEHADSEHQPQRTRPHRTRLAFEVAPRSRVEHHSRTLLSDPPRAHRDVQNRSTR